MASNYKGIIFDKLKSKNELPDWFDKDISKQQITEKEQQELQNILDDF